MKKIIIAPDSFKETMSNIEVANVIYNCLKTKYPEYDYKVMPVADGGEGSLNAIMNDNNMDSFICNNANMEACEIKYGILNNCGIVEVAENIGYKHKREYSHPNNTTSYGVGEVIKEIITKGIKKIYICLGGTITNDGGCGLASALGVKFYDDNNHEFIPVGHTLKKISKIDNSHYLECYKDITIIGLCDVINPLYGKNGASYIYAPQKGADEQEVEELDYGLRQLEKVVLKDLKIDVANHPGSGAAGGLGYAILSFLNGKLQKGIQTILSIMEFNKKLDNDTIIITGEGKLDSQSMQGKVIDGIIRIARKKNVPVIVVVGTYEGKLEDYYNMGIDKLIVTNPDNIPFEVVKQICKEQLKEAIDKLKI